MRVAKAVMWIGAVVLVAAGCGEPSNTGGTASPTNAYPTPGDKPLAGVNVGECISSSHVAQDLPGNVLSVTCPSPAAPYELAHKGLAEKGCPDAKAGDQGSAYARVTTTDRKTPTNPRPKSWVMCFALNMRSSPGTWCTTSSCDSSSWWFRRSVPQGCPPVLSGSR